MRTSPGGGHGSEGLDDLELRSADPFDAGGGPLTLGALWGSFCVAPAARSLGSRSLGGTRGDPEDVYDPAVARREREILEHAVHAVTKQAATADDLVDEALDDEAVVVGTAGPIR